MKYLISTVLLLLMSNLCKAQDSGRIYSTESVRRTVQSLIPQVIDSLGTGNSELSLRGQKITVRIGKNGKVEHIGIPLFTDAARRSNPLPVYDYVEYALLDKTFQLSDNKLLYKDILFRKGNWKTLLDIKPDDDCNISAVDKKAYIIEWSKNGTIVAEMLVPISYSNLGNVPRREMEKNFMRDVAVFYPEGNEPLEVDEERLKKIKDGAYSFYMLKGRSYLNEAITNNTYYGVDANGNVVPIIDSRLPVQSIANMIMLNCSGVPDAEVDVEFILMEGKKEHMKVSMRQLVDFAKSQGCSPYFGYESTNDDVICGALFFYNELSGYAHVLSLKIDKNTIDTGKPQFTSEAFLYIPINNVKQKYGQVFGK